MRSITKKNIIIILILVLTLSGISLFLYVRDQNYFQNVLGDNTGAQIVKKERPQTILEQVSKIVELPEGEIPTITTVSDASKLSSQPLFKNAKNGDRVLIFTKSGIAIVYRPGTNKIIEYSNINLTKEKEE